jgi:hypothetical protein
MTDKQDWLEDVRARHEEATYGRLHGCWEASDGNDAHYDRAALLAEVDRLREALTFYADRARYHDTPAGENQWKTAEVVFDGGKTARRALSKGTTDV